MLDTLQWRESSKAVANSAEIIEHIQRLSFRSTQAMFACRRFVATLDSIEIGHCRTALIDARDLEAELEIYLWKDAAQHKTAHSIHLLVSHQADTMLAVLGSASAKDSDAEAIQQSLTALDREGVSSELNVALQDMESQQRLLLQSHLQSQAATAVISSILSITASLLSLLFIVAAGWRMSREQSRRNEVEKTLASKEEQYRRVVELAGDMIYRTDAQGRFTFCNQTLLSHLHFGKTEVIGRSYLKFIRQDKRRAAERFYIRQHARKQKSSYYEFPIVDGHGRERWVGQNVQLVTDGEKIAGFQAIARDITERKRTEQELKKSRTFIERIAATTPGILYVHDIVERRNIYSNREVLHVLGYRPEELDKAIQSGKLNFHPDDEPMVRAHDESMRHAPDGEVRRIEYRVRHANGNWVWLLTRTTPFERGPDGLVKQVVGIAQDITKRREADEKLNWQANFDALTGLSNRHHFWTGLQSLLRRASIEHSVVSLCLFDIDLFKEINDRHGHSSGDEVLENVGNIVRAELRPVDVAGRLGGDEFCFALPRTDANECARVAERIRERLTTMAFGMSTGAAFSVSATFGVAEIDSGMDAKELMEAADRALYRAKSAGRNRVVVDV